MREKYVLVKIEDWRDFLGFLENSEPRVPIEVRHRFRRLPHPRDFFAMVQGDVFAPAGLDTYAGVIEAVLKTSVPMFSSSQAVSLENLAEDLRSTAKNWRGKDARIPD